LHSFDVLVLNAGVGADVHPLDVTTIDVDMTLEVNLRSAIVLTTAFARSHVDLGRAGHVVVLGSLAGLLASPNWMLYNASKFGLRGFVLSYRQDLHGSGVGVSIVEPGIIRDAGMFARSGIRLPVGVRTRSPLAVAARS
jgi:short-subunit dehydrogenase